MQPLRDQAQFYAKYHHNEATRYTHMAGVPIIILSLMILLGFIHVVIPGVLDINLAEIATLGLIVFYCYMQLRLGSALIPILLILLWIAQFFSHNGPDAFSVWAFIIFFIVGCSLQMIGYIMEAKRPEILDNLWLALIAPLFLVAELFFLMGSMLDLKNQLYGKSPDTKKK